MIGWFRSGEVENDSALDLAAMHPSENIIDVLEPVSADRRMHFAVSGEG